MYFESLKHWNHIRQFTLEEAAMLIAGVDPTKETLSSSETSVVIVFQRAIAEAVQRADELAWWHAREIDRLSMQLELNAEIIADMRATNDIWEASENFADHLPTIEMRKSVAAVNADPINVPILIPVDPWYTATVPGTELNHWIQRTGIDSAYEFVDLQRVIVTAREENWDAEQSRLEREPGAKIALESVNAFAERSGILEKPLSTRERNVLLSIIAALCNESKIDYLRHAKAAGLIKDLAVSMGLSIGESTIENHLKRIPDALEARMK